MLMNDSALVASNGLNCMKIEPVVGAIGLNEMLIELGQDLDFS